MSDVMLQQLAIKKKLSHVMKAITEPYIIPHYPLSLPSFLSVHPSLILESFEALLLLCALAVRVFPPHKDAGRRGGVHVFVYLSACFQVGVFPQFFAARLLYVCMSLCPDRYTLSSPGLCILASGQTPATSPTGGTVKDTLSSRCASYSRGMGCHGDEQSPEILVGKRGHIQCARLPCVCQQIKS